jgi:hypothetical protein
MGISRYPRPGYRIAPSSLREVLNVEVRASQIDGRIVPVRLCDLDETVWKRFDLETCDSLAEAVVSRIRSGIRRVPGLLDKWLPPVPEGTKPEELEVEVRTYNCLVGLIARNMIDSLDYLSALTIKEILRTKNFGIKSLVDLLTSLESFNSSPVLGSQREVSKRPPTERTEDPHSSEIGRDNLLLKYMQSGGTVPQKLRQLSLPRPAPGLTLDDLDLEFRTRKCLEKAGFSTSLEKLGDKTVGDLLSIQGFGRKCLVDLLKSTQRRSTRIAHKSVSVAMRDHHPSSLEIELARIAQSCQKTRATFRKRNYQILLRYTGWDGRGGCPLQIVGDEFGMTRERVRQICDPGIEAIKKKRPSSPILDKAISLIAQQTPGVATRIESGFFVQDVSNQPFRLEGIVNAAELLGRKIPFIVEKVGQTRFVLPARGNDLPKVIVRSAKKFVSRWGVTTVEDLAAYVARKAGLGLNTDFVTQVLLDLRDFQWLDEQGGWFWLTAVPRNRILNQIRKILSVSDHLHVSELRGGLTRVLRLRGFAPPRRVILEMCRQIPGCRVEVNEIFVEPSYKPGDLLGETEITMLRVLRQDGPVLPSLRFEELCLSRGMNRATFYMFLQYSPIIAKYAYGVYGLRGAGVNPGFIESLAPRRRKTRVLADYGWTQDGNIWLGYKLSKGMISSGTLSIPAAMKGFVQGEFAIKTADGAQFGTLVTRDTGTWGLGTYFRRRGGEPGDSFLIVLNLSSREAFIYIGGEDLLDDIETVVDNIGQQEVKPAALLL